MIRINLLAVERERTKTRVKFDIGQRLTVLCSLILVATALGIGWWYWSLSKESAKLDQDIAAAEQETARLRTLIVQVQQFEERKGQLQQRVSLIEELRKGQSGPVHMLDEISKNLPDALWLTDLKQVGGDVTIEGRCTTLTALSDFVASLSTSAYFKKGVEILNSQSEASQPNVPDLIRFSIKAQFAPPAS